MTQREKSRFIILTVILVVLVIAGLSINRFIRNSRVGADLLGEIQNQAVATYKDADGLDMPLSLSNISRVQVSSGTNNIAASYNLEKKQTQSGLFDIQFYRAGDDEPLTTIRDKKGEAGTLATKLKNIPNGRYDISIKPQGYLSQVIYDYPYINGQRAVLDYKDPFLWGDINKKGNRIGDNIVNNFDWNVLIAAWGASDELADINGDGTVNNVDAGVMLANWGKEGLRFTEVVNTDEEIADSPDF